MAQSFRSTSGVLLLPAAVWLCVGAAAVAQDEGPGGRTLVRIDCGDVNDRLYLQGGFYPAGPLPDWTQEGTQWDWLKTLAVWEGTLVELPVIPSRDHAVRVQITPLEAAVFRFYAADSGLPREAYGPRLGTPQAPLLHEARLGANTPAVVQFDLPSELLAGREHVMLFTRPMEPDAPEEKAEVEFRTHWIEVLVKGDDDVTPEIARRQALEAQRLRAESERFTLVVSSTVTPDQPFRLTIVARGLAGFPDPAYAGTLRLYANSPNLRVPDSVTFTAADRGVRHLDDLACTADGAYLIRAYEGDDPSRTWRSNYVICDSTAPYRVYWGDLHIHTIESDGDYSLDAAYDFARNVSHLDFVAINDHDQWFSEEKWRRQQEKARQYDEPGRFATLFGTEWTSTHRGHHNVWFSTTEVPNPYAEVEPGEFYRRPVADVWEPLRPFGAIMCTHHLHPANDYSDWTVEREPVVEIYSTWGSSERAGVPEQTSIQHNWQRTQSEEPSNSAVELLNRGLKLGIIAGSDTHTSTPGANVSLAYRVGVSPYRRPGIAAVFVKELTGEAILDALRHRRCYGTMNERILIDFTINGHMMGEEFVLEGPVARARMRVFGTGEISSVSLIRNGEVIFTPIKWGSRDRVDLEFVDAEVPEGTNYYFVKVEQLLDGERACAWSSPIWVTTPSAE